MDAMILAAGNSRRFGSNKLCYPVNGKPMYRHIYDHLCQLQNQGLIQRLVVVTQYEWLFRELKQRSATELVWNQHPEYGISYSIRLGLRQLQVESHNGQCLFTVADQPHMRLETLEAFIRASEKNEMIYACSYGDQIGNPVIFPERDYPRLSSLTGDCGGRVIVRQNRERVKLFSVAKEELEDIDYEP